MIDSDYSPVRMAGPGRRTRIGLRVSKSILLIIVVLVSTAIGIPINLANPARVAQATAASSAQSASVESQSPETVGADAMPDLSLSRIVVSNIGGSIDTGGTVLTSPENVTLYNSAVQLRLIGMPSPHDELLDPSRRALARLVFWTVQVNDNGSWRSMSPISDILTILGTNSTGSYVVRSMNVTYGPYSGLLRLLYKALPSGRLNYDVEFSPVLTADYRLSFSWGGLTDNCVLSGALRQLQVKFDTKTYAFDWSDIPASLPTIPEISQQEFQLLVEIGKITGGSQVVIDPGFVDYTNSQMATAYTFQRKVFYDTVGNRYWAFYFDGTQVRYKYSGNGIGWLPTSGYAMPSGWPQWIRPANSMPSVYYSRGQVIVASGYENASKSVAGGSNPGVMEASVYYSVGTISGSQISWSSVVPVKISEQGCTSYFTSCLDTAGTRLASVSADSGGHAVFSFNWYLSEQNYNNPYTPCNFYYETSLIAVVGSGTTTVLRVSSSPYGGCYDYTQDLLASVISASDPSGGVRVVYQYAVYGYDYYHPATIYSKQIDIVSSAYNNATSTWQGTENVETKNVLWSPELSVAVDASYGMHTAFRMQNGTIEYGYHSSQGSWGAPENVFSGQIQNATLTVDYSTNTIYAFGLQGPSIVMKKKLISQSWKDVPIFSPVSNRNNPINLGSNLASMSASASNSVMLVWTEAAPSGSGYPYQVMFASIPIPTSWSPYASPSDPWDGNGIAPYGQYFTNLQESVSPSSGMLTVSQTDLSVPGRGMDLSITTIYTEPHGFLNGPYSYDSFPWAPLGNGWQLNFPWMSTAQNASYVHLWSGEGYQIPNSFWGTSPAFENDVGEHFRMVRNGTGVYLYASSGVAYAFDPASPNRLLRISDPIGNTITFSYSNNIIQSITDTVGRIFEFCYHAGLLQSINQTTTGNCNSSTGSVRGVVYAYNGPDLYKVWDPAGRLTKYNYSAVTDPNAVNWLISRITYPTSAYTNFSYTPYMLGTEATTYRTHVQLVNASPNTPVRQFNYTYTPGPGDQVTNSTVMSYNSTFTGGAWQLEPVSYTSYNFSTAKATWMIYGPLHQFVTGKEQMFGVHGEVPQEVTLTTDGGKPPKLGSYSNYYEYDQWGNLIYTRQVINPSAGWYHEAFNAYYNNGLPPGFYAFEENFGRNQGTAPNNPWNVRSVNWQVQNYAFNGTNARGNQLDMLAWADVGESSLSIQARVYITKEINTTASPSVGIFTNAVNGTNTREELVLTDLGGLGTYLSMTDPTGSQLQYTSCRIVLGAWYTFNMTSYSGNLQGWASTLGQPTCNLSGVSDTPGTGFGFYAGGFSALFTNVTVARVSPQVSGIGFSNSFFGNGAPGPNIHTALAGRAELQNETGPGLVPIETYNSYWAWGGLSQTKHLYNSPGGTRWLSSTLTYDSFGNPYQFTDPRGNTTTFSYSSRYQYAYLTGETQTLLPGNTPVTSSYGYNFTTGSRLSSVDPKGQNTTDTYDILGRVTRVTYPNGDYAAYSYNDSANYVDVTNENGWKTRQIYDGLGRLSATERLLNGKPYSNETLTYNWQDLVSTSIDALRNSTSYQYDVLGRIIGTTRPDGTSVQKFYNDTGSWVGTTDEYGNNACDIYDRTGRLVSVIEYSDQHCHPLSVAGYTFVTNYYYDEAGNLDKTVAANLQLTVHNYDNLNRLIKTSYPDQTSESYSYDDNGNLALATDRKNVQTGYSYDSLNRVILVKYYGATVTNYTYTYDADSNVLRLQSQNATLGYSYDSRNRVTGESYSINGGGVTFDFSISNSGSISAVQGGTGYNTITTTLVGGSTQQVSLSCWSGLPAGASCSFSPATSYPSFSSTLTVTTSSSTPTGTYTITVAGTGLITHTTWFTLTVSASGGGGGGGSVARGSLITLAGGTKIPVQDIRVGDQVIVYNVPTGYQTVAAVYQVLTVNVNSTLTIRTTAGGRPFRSDANPAMKMWVLTSSGPFERPITTIKRGDQIYNYDIRSWVRVTDVTITYGGKHTMYDLLTTPNFTSNGLILEYIANGYPDCPPRGCKTGPTPPPSSPSSPSSPTGGALSSGYYFNYTYDGEVLQDITYSNLINAFYTYDGLGRVQSVLFYQPLGDLQNTTFTYLRNDQIENITYGNGLAANYTYDKLARPVGINLYNGQNRLLSLVYSYNKTGTVASVTGRVNGAVVNEQYRYDPLQRLTNSTVTSNGGSTSLWYQYDSLGNRIWQSVNGTKTSYSYNNLNELTKACVTPTGLACSTTTVYSYDGDGNLLTKNVTTTSTTHWIYAWNPTGTLGQVSNDTGIQGIYAYDGLSRRVESKEGSTTTFYAYTGTETLAEQAPNGTATDYVYADGLMIARVSISAINYYHTDALGSTRLVTDANRNIVFTDGYQPYGQENGTHNSSQAYKFTGKPVSQTTGLYYDYQRWYDPSVGRFISGDPSGGLNLYVYALNEPTRFVDPNGAAPVDAFLNSLARTSVALGLVFARRMRWEYDWGLLGSGGFQTLSLPRRGTPPDEADHVLAVGWRPKSSGETEPIFRLDRGNPKDEWFVHQDYHITWGESTPVPASNLGKAAEFFLDNGAKIRTGLLVAGALVSVWNIYSAYQQDSSAGQGYSRTIETGAGEAGGWIGSIGGCYAGGAIGTVLLPGIGTLAGCIGGGIIIGSLGQEGGSGLASILLNASWQNAPSTDSGLIGYRPK